MPLQWGDVWFMLFALLVVLLAERYDYWVWRKQQRRRGADAPEGMRYGNQG